MHIEFTSPSIRLSRRSLTCAVILFGIPLCLGIIFLFLNMNPKILSIIKWLVSLAIIFVSFVFGFMDYNNQVETRGFAYSRFSFDYILYPVLLCYLVFFSKISKKMIWNKLNGK